MIVNSTWTKLDKMCDLAFKVINNFGNGTTQYASFICHDNAGEIEKWKSKSEEHIRTAINDSKFTLKEYTDVNRLTSSLKDAREMLENCPGHHQNKVHLFILS